MSNENKFEHKGRVIRAEMETSATPQQAWEAWADPEKIAQWFVDRASGEAKSGGTMTWFFDNFGYVLPFKVLDAVPGELFVLKWDPPEGISGLLEVRITREGGSTLVRLIQSGFREDAKWDEEYEGTASGWQMALAILRHYLENYLGHAKKQLLLIRPAAFDYTQLRPYFLDASKLSEWLTTAGSIGNVGDPCHLALRDAGKLTGRVLAVTKREVALSWEEIGGTLDLKGFSMGPQRVLGVRCFSWTKTAGEMKQLESQLGAAVERLASHFPILATATEGAKAKTPLEGKS
jgi:uncharacterized protein YndB with AHSA1/START domain